MTIELILLILESILLIATIILLIFSIKEGRGRKDLLLEVERTTRILTREEYFLTVTDAMMEAKEEIAGCITGRLPIGDDKKRTRDVVNAIERLTRNGIKIKYLLPKFPDRLHVGYLYSMAGAEVKYSGCPIVHDIRYIIVDKRLVVIGIPESTGEKEATKKGYRIPSEGLASILKEHLESCWNQNIPFEKYVQEVLEQTGATPRLLAREMQLDDEEALEKFAKIS